MENQVCLILCLSFSLYWLQEDEEPGLSLPLFVYLSLVSTGIRKMENQVCLILCLSISLYLHQEDGEPDLSHPLSVYLSLLATGR